jgi:hypothetical protein
MKRPFLNKVSKVSPSKLQHQGKFWPRIRAMIWEKAEELFMAEQAKTMEFYNRPEKCELLEGGYFHEAKLIVLRNLWREKRGLAVIEEEDP